MLLCTCLRKKKERRLLSKGLDRVDDLLEIDQFLKTSMQVRIALKAMFSKTERFLMRNNKVFVLGDSSSSNMSESDQDVNEKTLNQELQRSRSPFLRPLYRSALKQHTKETHQSRDYHVRNTSR